MQLTRATTRRRALAADPQCSTDAEEPMALLFLYAIVAAFFTLVGVVLSRWLKFGGALGRHRALYSAWPADCCWWRVLSQHTSWPSTPGPGASRTLLTRASMCVVRTGAPEQQFCSSCRPAWCGQAVPSSDSLVPLNRPSQQLNVVRDACRIVGAVERRVAADGRRRWRAP